MEQHASNQALTMTSTSRDREIDSLVYDNKVRINHWNDKMMEHKKIYYAAELKMYQLELALAKWDNSNKKRWSVRHREIVNPIRHDPPLEKPKRAPHEPAFGYVPVTRKLKRDVVDVEEKEQASNQDKETPDKDIKGAPARAGREFPEHSEDYKPFASTPSIHSYMYHLRQIYGK